MVGRHATWRTLLDKADATRGQCEIALREYTRAWPYQRNKPAALTCAASRHCDTKMVKSTHDDSKPGGLPPNIYVGGRSLRLRRTAVQSSPSGRFFVSRRGGGRTALRNNLTHLL